MTVCFYPIPHSSRSIGFNYTTVTHFEHNAPLNGVFVCVCVFVLSLQMNTNKSAQIRIRSAYNGNGDMNGKRTHLEMFCADAISRTFLCNCYCCRWRLLILYVRSVCRFSPCHFHNKGKIYIWQGIWFGSFVAQAIRKLKGKWEI